MAFGEIDRSTNALFRNEIRRSLTRVGNADIVNIDSVPESESLVIDLDNGMSIQLDIRSHNRWAETSS